MIEGRYVQHHFKTGSILATTSAGIVKERGFKRMSLEERWGLVDFELEDLCEDDMPWYSFWDDVRDGWLKQTKSMKREKVEWDWLHCHGVHV